MFRQAVKCLGFLDIAIRASRFCPKSPYLAAQNAAKAPPATHPPKPISRVKKGAATSVAAPFLRPIYNRLVGSAKSALSRTLYCKAAFTKSAARSPIMMLGALVLPETRRGMMLASATHKPSTPCTFNVGSTTASASLPMRHVPTG